MEERVVHLPAPDNGAIYLPTYSSAFRCPECDRMLPRSVTAAVGPRLERCMCGYDPNLPQSHSPLPIA